jgi:N-acetylneuraminic acid mutarotase
LKIILGIALNSKTKNQNRFPVIDQVLLSILLIIGHSSVVIGNEMYVFGGKSRTTNLNDLYKLDLKEFIWTPIICKKNTLPLKRFGHTLMANKGTLILFGGFYVKSYY